ncbi:MAG: arsenate reductase (glutaredoxin) [Sinobacterium sp.]
MSDLSIYHNPRCSKSRQTLALLKEQGLDPEVILYLDTPLKPVQLKAVLAKLAISPRELLRKGEGDYKEQGLADKNLTDAYLIKMMCQFPKLIERPIVVKGNKAVLGRPPENALALIK